jgi:hypothetical protein
MIVQYITENELVHNSSFLLSERSSNIGATEVILTERKFDSKKVLALNYVKKLPEESSTSLQ